MSRLLAIAAILLSVPASAQILQQAQLNDANNRPYMTFKLYVDGVEVPVTPTGGGTQCDGGSCDFTTRVITQGRDVSVRFIPKVERDELGANNFSLNSLALQGATLENLTNISPDNWHGRGPGFNPDTTKGVEWTADLIPTPGARNQSLDITIESQQFGWRAWQSGTMSGVSRLTFRMRPVPRLQPTPVPVIPVHGLWLLVVLLSLIGVGRLFK